ncbi:uncharacterized protein LOC105197951 [Solenopsis invicta]|uniref:uncharacterized protein LOC105197951 n=1 Tax=Solenopsis invicta TaxID=13686 RepID=UPI000E33F0E5|nr:uncharacterized protein LOC105197951 [Solenopsis invicta]
MDFVGERYYKLNKILLLCLGLWPCQTSTLKKTQIIFFQTLFISFLVCQWNSMLVQKYSIEFIIKITMFITINCIFIVKYNAFLLLDNKIKYIFDRIQYDWNMLKAQVELEMIRKYANTAKLFTVCFIILVTTIIPGLLVILSVPRILDVIVPMNESRQRQSLIQLEYFIDEETYFFASLIYIILTISVGTITIAAIATIHMAYVLHACAMFQIASHRIEHIFDNLQQIPKDIKKYMLCNKLIHAVYVHRRAVDFTKILTNTFATLYFVLLGLGVVSMSLSFLNFIYAVLSLKIWDVLICSYSIFVHMYYIFVGNFIGQNVIDTSIDICRASYNAQWYVAPLYMQKLILFIMQRSNKRSALIAGGLFDASLEGFATLMSMSVSYVMVLQSIGHKENYEKKNDHI